MRSRTGIGIAVLAALAAFGASDGESDAKQKGLRAELAELEARIAQLESQMGFLLLRDGDAGGLADCADPCAEDPSSRCECTLGRRTRDLDLRAFDGEGDGTTECGNPEPPPSGECVVTGCSRHVCADEPVITTCEWFDRYACYRTASCERQADGRCGWTPTEELSACLAAAGPPPPVIPRSP
jgi:hypothetical protein